MVPINDDSPSASRHGEIGDSDIFSGHRVVVFLFDVLNELTRVLSDQVILRVVVGHAILLEIVQ